jgi:hypothetical protein
MTAFNPDHRLMVLWRLPWRLRTLYGGPPDDWRRDGGKKVTTYPHQGDLPDGVLVNGATAAVAIDLETMGSWLGRAIPRASSSSDVFCEAHVVVRLDRSPDRMTPRTSAPADRPGGLAFHFWPLRHRHVLINGSDRARLMHQDVPFQVVEAYTDRHGLKARDQGADRRRSSKAQQSLDQMVAQRTTRSPTPPPTPAPAQLRAHLTRCWSARPRHRLRPFRLPHPTAPCWAAGRGRVGVRDVDISAPAS